MKNVHLINSLLFSLVVLAHGCQAQSAKSAGGNTGSSGTFVGGPCDGCDIMWIGMPPIVGSTDTTSGWKTAGQKLVVSGRVYMKDGRTPVAGVLLYYWQTDNNGYYSPAPGLPEKAARHGHLRGWVKTDKEGNYAIYTIRPLPYPGENIPAHIHMLVKQPSVGNEYYIDDILFEDDRLLNTARRAELESRGGNGIVKVKKDGPVHKASRDIVLGLNIPDYPGSGK